MEIKRNNYTIEFEEPEIYVDNEKRGRSGHMTHAMAEFAPNCFIDFNSNCSAERFWGHSAFGWIEYRISKDGGKTYSEVADLPFSKKMLYDGIYTISVEKAVACNDGSIVAFCLRNNQLDPVCCEPWATPLVIISRDEGKTWSEPYEFTPFAGRIYDAVYYNGNIYVLIFCNEHFIGETEEHKYRIYKSSDNGKNFEELCVIPFDTNGRAYASIIFDDNGILHAFAYNSKNEAELDHAISRDFGENWEICRPCSVPEGVRNPQSAIIDGIFVLHGRTANKKALIFYTSENGFDWDEGYKLVQKKSFVGAYYSNNIRLIDEKGEFLLVQYSDTYVDSEEEVDEFVDGWGKVNVMHAKVRIHKK